MKQILTAIALAAFGLAPAIGVACEDYDATSAAATPASLMASAPAPAVSKAPATAVTKALAPNATRQTAAKTKAQVPQQKVAVNTAN